VNALPPDTLACWMEGLGGRIELIQIPQPRPAADAFEDEHYVGYYHLSFDITDVAAELPSWLTALKERFTSAKDPARPVPTPKGAFGADSTANWRSRLRSRLWPMPMAYLEFIGF